MDWQKVDAEIDKLSSMIQLKPDIIVVVVRGGLIPGRLLAKKLGVREMYALTIKKEASERTISSSINENVEGKNILLVEDALETGASMMVSKQYLETLGATVQTAALYFQPRTKVIPDYTISEVENIPTFPWDWSN